MISILSLFFLCLYFSRANFSKLSILFKSNINLVSFLISVSKNFFFLLNCQFPCLILGELTKNEYLKKSSIQEKIFQLSGMQTNMDFQL